MTDRAPMCHLVSLFIWGSDSFQVGLVFLSISIEVSIFHVSDVFGNTNKSRKKSNIESNHDAIVCVTTLSVFSFFFFCSASGTNVVAIDNKIEQAMVSIHFTTNHICLSFK